LRLGLIGCGWIVERGHSPAIEQATGAVSWFGDSKPGADLTVVATADLSLERAQRLAKRHGLAEKDAYDDYRRLLERPDVDVVSIATPPDSHLEITRLAAAAGKHVACEKPIATTLADADAMIAACAAAKVTLAVYHNYLYYAQSALVRQLVDDGAIGDVEVTEIAGLGARPWVGAPEFRPGWRRSIPHAGGGALVDVGVHAFYLTSAFHNAPITAVSAAVGFDQTGLDDLALCRLEAGAGHGLVNVGWRQGGARVVVMGTRGYAEVIFDEGVGYYGYPARGVRLIAEGKPTVTHYAPYFTGMFAPQLFIDLAETLSGRSKVYPARGEDARAALEVAMAAYASAASQAVVRLPLAKDSAVYREGLAGLRPPVTSGGLG